MNPLLLNFNTLHSLPCVPAQMGVSITNGLIFAVLAGLAIFATIRSSRRS